MRPVFLHGLDSSSKGTKAVWFREHFPEMLIPDFTGPLAERMARLERLLAGMEEVVLVGSSFGGLMATLYALQNGDRLRRVVLLAPALNLEDFTVYRDRQTRVPAHLYIGSEDNICPPRIVIPAARRIFADISIHLTGDDHLLRTTFPTINWQELVA